MPANLILDVPSSLEARLQDLLTPDEVLEVKLKGQFKEALICTDRRVIILKAGLLTGAIFGTKLFQVPYRSITGVDVNFGGLFGVFEVMTGGNQYAKKSVWRGFGSDDCASEAPNAIALNGSEQADLFRQACSCILMRIDDPHVGARSPAPRATFSMADELRKLADLRREGVLTPEEFEAEKRMLLGERRPSPEVRRPVRTAAEEPDQGDVPPPSVDAAIQRALNERAACAGGRDGFEPQTPFGRRTSVPH